MNNNEDTQAKLIAVGASLLTMETSIAELALGLERALTLLRAEAEGQHDAQDRLEKKVDGVHDLVNSAFSAALVAQRDALVQLIEYMTEDLAGSPDESLRVRRDEALKQLDDVNSTISDRGYHA